MSEIFGNTNPRGYDEKPFFFGAQSLAVRYIDKLKYRIRFGRLVLLGHYIINIFDNKLNLLSKYEDFNQANYESFYFTKGDYIYIYLFRSRLNSEPMNELQKVNIRSFKKAKFESFKYDSFHSRTIHNYGFTFVDEKSGLQMFDLNNDKLLWKLYHSSIRNLVSDGTHLIGANYEQTKKSCFDLLSGEVNWTIALEDYKELSDLKGLGFNVLIADSIIGCSEFKYDPSNVMESNLRNWFAFDLGTQKLKWRRKLPFHLCKAIYADKCYHYLYRDMDKGTYFYSAVDLTTGKDVITVDITEEIIKNRPERRQPFYDDSWYRAMSVSENYIYFGIGVRFVRMCRVSYEIEVLYEGKSVFDNSEFAFGRLFVTEMIGGTVMLSEKGAPETDLDRFFMEG